MDNALAILNRSCAEVGVCAPPVSRPPVRTPVLRRGLGGVRHLPSRKVKCCHELSNGADILKMTLYTDGVITACALEAGGKPKPDCCFTSQPGEEKGYWEYRDVLVNKGYRAKEVSGG